MAKEKKVTFKDLSWPLKAIIIWGGATLVVYLIGILLILMDLGAGP